MWLVVFHSESGDRYYSLFQDEPSQEQLKFYMICNFPGEFELGMCYLHVSSIQKIEVDWIPDSKDVDSRLSSIGVSLDNIEWM